MLENGFELSEMSRLIYFGTFLDELFKEMESLNNKTFNDNIFH